MSPVISSVADQASAIPTVATAPVTSLKRPANACSRRSRRHFRGGTSLAPEHPSRLGPCKAERQRTDGRSAGIHIHAGFATERANHPHPAGLLRCRDPNARSVRDRVDAERTSVEDDSSAAQVRPCPFEHVTRKSKAQIHSLYGQSLRIQRRAKLPNGEYISCELSDGSIGGLRSWIADPTKTPHFTSGSTIERDQLAGECHGMGSRMEPDGRSNCPQHISVLRLVGDSRVRRIDA